ncbi:S-layer homology domain-containing protein [Paenibacillus sp. MSJ-34]|uniref:S-layer homology domain-containing protein n=1 Tax=Paenibacillus sp. MSJ-34 TaxID=2841529 RepID=UPI001C115326|nr:S-layer homology domain-containing protein [Paenibacillus sp. MSJ-34]MBU5445324.1 lamin tail domain-containing protein [Paenibacillus sp. MSJ-34]
MLRKWKKAIALPLLLALAMAQPFGFAPAGQAYAETPAPELMITEIVPASSETGQPYEYVEIYNNTSHAIDLKGYRLQYFTKAADNFTSVTNNWTLPSKTIDAKGVMVLWLKKFDYPDAPLWDFNANYGVRLTPEQVIEVKLTTSAQGLHDTDKRKLGIADPAGRLISSAYINDGAQDGKGNLDKSVIYRHPAGGGVEMERIGNGQAATPGVVLDGQAPGPAAPAAVSAQPGDRTVTLSWNAVDQASHYIIYQSGIRLPQSVTGITYAIEALENDDEYAFRVTAVDDNGDESPASAPVKATPQAVVDNDPPHAPQELKAASAPDSVTLSWSANAEPDMRNYNVYVNDTIFAAVPATVYSAKVAPLVPERQYEFKVTAVDRAGNESVPAAITAGPSTLPPVRSDLLITELVPDTDNYASYDAFEYVELYNAGDDAVDLQGYALKSSSWTKTIDRSVVVPPGGTIVVWTRRAEISPLTLEGFNHYYYASYPSKFIAEDQLYIAEDIGGLVNGGATVTLLDAEGNEIRKAEYAQDDVALGKSVVYAYPEDGGVTMRKVAGKQPPTPGTIVQGQAPLKDGDHEPPAAPTGLTAEGGDGTVLLRWTPNGEADVARYNIYKNGRLEHTVSADIHEFSVYLLTGNETYTFELTAEDAAGNESMKSAAATAEPGHQMITQEQRADHPKDPAYQTMWDVSAEGPVIPGLKQDLVPQGLAYDQEHHWLLVVAYLNDGRPATLSIMDAGSGSLLKSVVLYEENGQPYTGHAGGVAVSRKHVWIASEQYLYRLDKNDIVAAGDSGQVQFQGRIPVVTEAAFVTYADDTLWVGEFYESASYPTDPSHHLTNRDGDLHYAWMAAYRLDPATDELPAGKWDGNVNNAVVPDSILSIREKVQGAVIRDDSIILSTSYGRNKDSDLFRYNNPLSEDPHTTAVFGGQSVPVWFLDGESAKPNNSRLTILPMSEGIVGIGDDLYVVFESGATKYRFTTTYVMDRMLKLNLEHWDAYGTDSIRGIPSEMKVGETAQANVTRAQGSAQPIDATESYTFASSDPAVAEASPTGAIQAKAVGRTVISATDGDHVLTFALTVTSKPSGGDRPGSGGSGTSSSSSSQPSSGASKPGTAEEQPGQIVLGPVDFKQGDQTVRIELTDRIHQVVMPANAYELLGERSLELSGGNGTFQLASKLLQSAFQSIPGNERNDAQIAVSVPTVSGERQKALLAGAARNERANLSAASEMFELGLAVTTASGTRAFAAFDPPIAVSLPASPAANPELVGLYAVRDDGTLAYVGGKWDGSSMTAEIGRPGQYILLEYKKTFGDMPAHHWSTHAVQVLSAKQIATGLSAEEFAPARNITRAEFAALLVRALHLEGNDRTGFSDVPSNAWYAEPVAAAAANGVALGFEDGTFAPNEPITREQMALMLVRAMQAAGEGERDNGNTHRGEENIFADESAISGWAKPSVNLARANGLIAGKSDNRFDPQSLTTRAESAQAVYNLLQRLELLNGVSNP